MYKNIKENMAWGDISKMSATLLFVLDILMDKFDVVIHCGYETDGHASNGYHSKHGFGGAVDFHLISNKTLDNQFIELKTFLDTLNIPYRLGVYPFWNNKGFHLDLAEDKGQYKNLFWHRNKAGSYVYNYEFAKALIALRMEV